MSTVREKIEAGLKKAMLSKDEVARDALRMAKADLLNREVELGRGLEDAEAFVVLQKAVKTRRDSIETYESGGRADAADKERKDIAIIEAYLPKQLDEAETRKVMTAIAAEIGATTKKEMGKLMKELKARHDNVDGKLAAKIAGEILS